MIQESSLTTKEHQQSINRCNRVYVRRTMGTNGRPGTNTVSGRENRFLKEVSGLERTRKEHWLCGGLWMGRKECISFPA